MRTTRSDCASISDSSAATRAPRLASRRRSVSAASASTTHRSRVFSGTPRSDSVAATASLRREARSADSATLASSASAAASRSSRAKRSFSASALISSRSSSVSARSLATAGASAASCSSSASRRRRRCASRRRVSSYSSVSSLCRRASARSASSSARFASSTIASIIASSSSVSSRWTHSVSTTRFSPRAAAAARSSTTRRSFAAALRLAGQSAAPRRGGPQRVVQLPELRLRLLGDPGVDGTAGRALVDGLRRIRSGKGKEAARAQVRVPRAARRMRKYKGRDERGGPARRRVPNMAGERFSRRNSPGRGEDRGSTGRVRRRRRT